MMAQLELFDPPAELVPEAEVEMDAGTRLATEYQRGDLAFWDRGVESRWRAGAPSKPMLPRVPGISSWKLGICPNSRCPKANLTVRRFDDMVRSGRDYMVGDGVPLATFIRSHRSSLTEWQKEAFLWARANPFYRLQVETPGKEWEVYAEGNYVVFALPYHLLSALLVLIFSEFIDHRQVGHW